LPATPLPPPGPLEAADLSQLEAVFTDVDGTLTTDGHLRSSTLAAIEALVGAGVRVVLVSGRPAGWGECWARTLPVDGVIVENGGVYFARGAKGRVKKVYALPPAKLKAARAKLLREVKAAMKRVKGARLSSDSAYTEVDLAIDYNEEVHLGPKAAQTLEALLRKKKINAVRSSVHVNCWIGAFDKLVTARRFLKAEWKVSLAPQDARYAYVGDSFNDAPMFGGLGISVGVANVRDVLDQLTERPAFLTPSPEGRGFEELAQAVLAQRAPALPASATS
jgi:HAD superfamily hydrolase (TIGR01484 family)